MGSFQKIEIDPHFFVQFVSGEGQLTPQFTLVQVQKRVSVNRKFRLQIVLRKRNSASIALNSRNLVGSI